MADKPGDYTCTGCVHLAHHATLGPCDDCSVIMPGSRLSKWEARPEPRHAEERAQFLQCPACGEGIAREDWEKLPDVTDAPEQPDPPRCKPSERWLVLIGREGEDGKRANEISFFETREQALAHADKYGWNWSETYVAAVLRGPLV
jgi:hypothetical protein